MIDVQALEQLRSDAVLPVVMAMAMMVGYDPSKEHKVTEHPDGSLGIAVGDRHLSAESHRLPWAAAHRKTARKEPP